MKVFTFFAWLILSGLYCSKAFSENQEKWLGRAMIVAVILWFISCILGK